MAYRPPIVSPKTHRGKSARAALAAKERRTALVTALRDRLAAIVANMPKQQPDLPPQQPFREQPIPPPQGLLPPAVAAAPPPPPPPAAPFPSQGPPGWVPPSAFDWIRQPGFYDEPPSGDRRFI